MKKTEMLMDLYKALWVSPDFEHDFECDWRTIYNILLEDNAVKKLPEPLVKCCYQYLQDWEAKNC